jgi:hypothetical protein
MSQVTEYKQHAKDCRALAASSLRSDDKAVLKEIAKIWDKIAALREGDLAEPDEKVAVLILGHVGLSAYPPIDRYRDPLGVFCLRCY